MAKLLASATLDFLPCLAIGGFAGLRPSKILALDWGDVRLAERTIEVIHRKACCAGTRLAPITDNLAMQFHCRAPSRPPLQPFGPRRHRYLPAGRQGIVDRWRGRSGHGVAKARRHRPPAPASPQ